jgi:hypothetical protein
MIRVAGTNMASTVDLRSAPVIKQPKQVQGEEASGCEELAKVPHLWLATLSPTKLTFTQRP